MTDKILSYLNKNKPIETICKELDLKPYEVYGLVQELINEGYPYQIIDSKIVKKPLLSPDKTIYIPSKEKHTRLLLISDTHLCSRFDRLDILRYLYKKAEDTGTNYVLHSGDFTDGKSNRPEHVYELKTLSFEGQVSYCQNEYPISNVPTYIISGNHDDWWYKSTGSDIVKCICKDRPDLHYLGPDSATIKIGDIRVHLFHGKGSQAYAKSYKAQKYLDSLPYPRPHILQMGHIHQAFFYQQDYTSVFQTSCLEDETPFARSLGLQNDKSCWWVDIDTNLKGEPQKITSELERFGKKRVRKH